MKKKILKIILGSIGYIILTTCFAMPFILCWASNSVHYNSIIPQCPAYYSSLDYFIPSFP